MGKTVKYLTHDEQKRLMRAVDEVKGQERDAMVLRFGFFAGLRLAEIHGLNVGDVRGAERLHVRAETAKRGKAREVPLAKELRREIARFIQRKLRLGESIADDAPLFISQKGGRLARRTIQEVVEKACHRAGLTRIDDGRHRASFSTHALRHSFAKRALDRGAQLPTVQRLLGHASMGTTGVYLQPSKEELDAAVEALG